MDSYYIIFLLNGKVVDISKWDSCLDRNEYFAILPAKGTNGDGREYDDIQMFDYF